MKSTRLRHLLFLLTSTAALHAQSLIEQDCTIQIQSTGVKLLNWTGHVGRTYFIQSSPDLANWSWAPNIEAGENRPMSYEVDGPAKAGFFRLQYTDLTAPNLDSADFDSDGLTNLEEITQRPRPTGASLNQSLQTNSVMPVPMSTRQISRMSTRATPSQNIQTNPLKADTDDDGLNDKWEVDHQLDPTDNGSNNINNGPNGDPDQDGLDNLTEYQNGTNPFGNANTSDSDGDGILDIEDAMPGYGLVSWKRAPECNYVLIEVDSPSAYGYAEDLNDNGEVLFPDGIWSGGNWIARPPVQGIGEDPRGNEYELIPEGWLYFNANQQLLGRARLGWTGGPDEKVGGDGIPSVPTFLPSGQSTLTLLSDIQNFWNHEPRCYPIGIDSDGNMTFRISATGNATETFSTAIINKYNPSGTRIAELDGSNGFHPASSGDTSSSGWVASNLRRDSSSGQSAAYKVGLWDPSDHPVTLPAEANGWGYPVSAKDLPDGQFVLTAGVDNGTDMTGRVFLKNPAGQFEYATKLADKKLELFAGDGTALTSDNKLWRNGELTPLADLCPRYKELLVDHHIFPIRSNKNGTYLVQIESTNEGEGTWKNALLLPVEVSRDRNNNLAWKEKLDDWPEETSTSPPVTKPRSPKHLLAKEDNIRIRLPGLQGTSDVKIKVTSESDTAGVTLDLTDVNGGLENTGANKLRLADTSGSSADAKTIKVVDEEVLRFTLIINGQNHGEVADVMIDRAEFASGGAVFYTSTDGDRTVVRDKALADYKFFDNGDLQLPDDSPGSRALATSFLKNGGDNTPNSKQADIIHFASHGGGDGKLSDNTNTLFDPSSDLGGGTTWNSDIEWVVLASCLQLNEAGGGKDAWKNWLDSSPRTAHGILGAYQPLSGNLQGEVESFWSRLNDEQVGPYLSIPQSYSLAMEAGGEPWAMIYHTQNQLDLLRVHQRDDNSAGTTYTYLTGISGFNFVCGRDGDVSGKAAPIPVGDGLGTMRFNQAQVEKALPAMLDRIAVTESEVPVEKLGLGHRLYKGMKGNKIAIGKFDLSKSSGLTLEDAEAISAKKVLESTEPNSRFKLEKRFVGKRERIDSRNGHDQKTTTGYLVNYVTTCDGIPIWDSYINFSICGDQIESVGMKLLKSTEMQNPTFTPASFKKTFSDNLKPMKDKLKINKPYDILHAEICYKKDPASPGTLVPTWHLLVNLSPERKFKELRHIWLSAKDGRCVDSQDKL